MTPELAEVVVPIELSGFASHGAGARPTQVYLLTGSRPALIGAGHPAHAAELVGKLAERGVMASDVQRVVVGSWAPEFLGGCRAFPRADVFVLSPDMVRPRAYNAWLDRRRAQFLGVADEVFERVSAWGRADLVQWEAAAFPAVSNHLDFIPLRDGQEVRAGELTLKVIASPGCDPGHALLWSSETRACFAACFEMEGLPLASDAPGAYIAALERALELDPVWLFPGHGRPSADAARTLKRLVKFCSNYLQSAPNMLSKPKTILEIVDADMGYLPESPVPYIEAVLLHRAFIEELAAWGVVRAEGEGLDRRYGG